MDGVFWIHWTVRLAMVCYALALASMRFNGLGDKRVARRSRLLWTLAWGLLCLHVLLAFGAFHNWSHAAAYDDTARKTNAVVGWNWGGGIYFNEALLVLWGIDVVWWWLSPINQQTRARWLTWTWQCFVAFMAVNATIVFETGIVRWAGWMAIAGLISVEITARLKAPRQINT